MDAYSERSTSSEESLGDKIRRLRARVFAQDSSDSELGSDDDYDTDDSNTFGWNLQTQYPIRSVTLNTGDIYQSVNPGLINSGAIDQWITAIVLKFNRRKVANFALMKYDDGPGKALETVIQDMAVYASYTGRRWSRPSDDNKLKRIWTDFTKTAELVDEGLRLQLPLGERVNVFHHLRPVTTFMETVVCACTPKRFKRKSHNYLRIRNQRDLEKTLSNRVPVTSFGGLVNCRRCQQPYRSEKITVPDRSWILVFEVDENSGVEYNDFQRKIQFGRVGWSLTYITFAGPAYRQHNPLYFSLQFVTNRTFMYDGCRDRGVVRTFVDNRQTRQAKLERAVYFRDAV